MLSLNLNETKLRKQKSYPIQKRAGKLSYADLQAGFSAYYSLRQNTLNNEKQISLLNRYRMHGGIFLCGIESNFIFGGYP